MLATDSESKSQSSGKSKSEMNSFKTHQRNQSVASAADGSRDTDPESGPQLAQTRINSKTSEVATVSELAISMESALPLPESFGNAESFEQAFH